MRIRVHELARELGVSSARILAELGKMGEFVKSASSVLDSEVAAAVRGSFNFATAPPSRRNPFTSNVPATPAPRPARSSRAVSTQSCWDDDYWDDPPRPREAELTAAEAALELGVRPSTVRQWVRRGYLTSSGVRGRARLYERGALERARAETRSRTRHPAPPAPVQRELTRRPVNTNEAAQIAGVAPSTIRMWVHRRRLHPLPTPGPAHAFDPLEVLRVARRR